MSSPSYSRAVVALLFGLNFTASPAATEKWETTLTNAAPNFPGPRPIRLRYNFSWSGFPGASGEVRLTKPSADRFQLDGAIHTTGLVRTLWKCDATLTSIVDAKTLHPRSMKQTENVRNKKTVTSLLFDSAGVTSRETETPNQDDGPKVRRFENSNLFDLYSALLYLRSQPLQDRNVQRIVVYATTSGYLATVTVLGHERFTGATGTFNSIKLDLQLNKIGKNRELEPHKKFRRATAWLSDDSDRLLLRVQAQVFVGTVMADLQSIEVEGAR